MQAELHFPQTSVAAPSLVGQRAAAEARLWLSIMVNQTRLVRQQPTPVWDGIAAIPALSGPTADAARAWKKDFQFG